jgi:hypothetical protein
MVIKLVHMIIKIRSGSGGGEDSYNKPLVFRLLMIIRAAWVPVVLCNSWR